jgi:hypothetical protein
MFISNWPSSAWPAIVGTGVNMAVIGVVTAAMTMLMTITPTMVIAV